MSLQVTRLTDNAILPQRSTPGAAGLDLHSAEGYVVLPGHRVVVSTGIAIKLPPGCYGRIAPRSGLAVKHGLDVLAGVIDQDYTGELKVVLVNTDMRLPFHIKPGYRIAQLVMEMYVHGDVIEVQGPPPPTERGDAGFGSSGLAPAPSVQQHYKVTGV